MSWINTILKLLGFGFKVASTNQSIINSKPIVDSKTAADDAKLADKIQKDTQKGNIDEITKNLSH